MMWNVDFSGKTALVVGGSRGIGASACRMLADAGAAVAVADILAADDLCAEIRAAGGQAISVTGDITDPARVDALFSRVETELGAPELLAVTAGITSRYSFTDLTLAEWHRVMEVNLTGSFLVVQRAVPAMLRAGKGSIVLVGSQVSIVGGGGGAHYASSKAGLEGLVHHLSRELLPKGIRVNAVLPSTIDTDLFRERYPDPAERAAVAAQIPAQRLGTPEDGANAIVFLLSDRASYVCGHSLLVDGGRTYYR
ncbi:MAG: SDR family oxidoreductase [Armatimonadetes bacterium]|nr:SDR family oxidoreductase [Armatimonadota bacterium]